jgi:hypothetical protein
MGQDQGQHGDVSSEKVIIMMGFHPSVSYRPIPGLVALFTRGHHVRETLEHLTHAPAQPQAFYTDVVKSSMEHRNFNGNDNRGGNACGLVV